MKDHYSFQSIQMSILFVKPFSNKYLESKDNSDEQGKKYYNLISEIATNIFEIRVCSGLSDVQHNLDYDYEGFIRLLMRKDNFRYFNDIDKIDPLKSICKDLENSFLLPNNCLDIISSFTYKKIPTSVLNDIINVWLERFQEQIDKINSENEFDLNWYNIGSQDYYWARDTIRSCQEVLFDIEERFTNPGQYYKDKYKDKD